MMKLKFIKGKNILCPQGYKNGVIVLEGTKIKDVLAYDEIGIDIHCEDIGDAHLMPGIIDCHVHINEPGRTDWEGFETATKASAAGGITSLIEMPLNASPVTTTLTNFEIKLEAATGKLAVNCGFWGGVVPDNLADLDALLQGGVFGLKAFLTHSGIDDFPNTTAVHLRKALEILKKYDKPLLVHCELDSVHDDQILLEQNPRSYSAYLKSRPKSWENKAVQLMIDLCRETGARVHLVHISSAEALPLIAAAKAEGLPLTAETCPHYLFFNSEMIPDGNTAFKCAPPIREKSNNEQLWQALKEGTLDFVVTDHSPAPPELKEIQSGNFKKAWGGIAGLQFSLPVLWTGAKQRGFTTQDISRWMTSNIADFIGLSSVKGKIQKGYDADFLIWNPSQQFRVEPFMIQHKHKLTPYSGLNLFGEVEQCYVGGECVYADGKFLNLNKGNILLFS